MACIILLGAAELGEPVYDPYIRQAESGHFGSKRASADRQPGNDTLLELGFYIVRNEPQSVSPKNSIPSQPMTQLLEARVSWNEGNQQE